MTTTKVFLDWSLCWNQKIDTENLINIIKAQNKIIAEYV